MKLPMLPAEKSKDACIVSFGEIMLRLSAPDGERFLQSPRFEAAFGGGEANVLVGLSRLGFRTRFITALPDNEIGHSAKQVLSGHNVDVSRILLKKNSRMGIYYIEKGAGQRPSKVIYDRADSALTMIGPGEVDWRDAFRDASWFHITGITPALSAGTAELAMESLKAAGEYGLITSIDLNFRSKLWNYGADPHEVMNSLAGLADVLIGNEEDFQKSLGIRSDIKAGQPVDREQYAALTREVLERFPRARLAAITLRESISASHNRWSACCDDRSLCRFSALYDIPHIVDRVGSGDSFCAGLICGLLNFSSPDEVLEFAAAASCLKHSIRGDFNLSTKDEILALMKGEGSGRIVR